MATNRGNTWRDQDAEDIWDEYKRTDRRCPFRYRHTPFEDLSVETKNIFRRMAIKRRQIEGDLDHNRRKYLKEQRRHEEKTEKESIRWTNNTA